MLSIMSRRQTLRNAYGTTGLFEYLTNAPWYSNEVFGNVGALNYMYLRNRSGCKFIAPLVYDFLQDDGTVSSIDKEYLAQTIWSLYGREWTKLWAAYMAEYNPLENYKVTETHEDTTTKTGTETDNVLHSGTDTRTNTLGTSVSDTGTIGDAGTRNMSESSNGTNANTVNNSVYGFNSTAASPTTTSASNGSSTDTHSVTKDDTSNTRTLNTKTTGSGSDTDELKRNTSDNRSYERDLVDSNEGGWTRSGALGYISFQRMLQEEKNYWTWDFFERVFQDIDKVLTIPVFDMDTIIHSKYYKIGEI